MKFYKINHLVYFIGVGLFWYAMLEFTTSLFLIGNQTKEVILFTGLLVTINFSLMFWIIKNYKKKRI